jgi:RNA recognition motif-containing protein
LISRLIIDERTLPAAEILDQQRLPAANEFGVSPGDGWGVNDDMLTDYFSQVGTVVSAKVIVDRDSNRSKGFGFVEMSSDDEAKAAIDKLNGTELDGRPITVNEARPREEKPRNSYGSGGGYNDRRY